LHAGYDAENAGGGACRSTRFLIVSAALTDLEMVQPSAHTNDQLAPTGTLVSLRCTMKSRFIGAAVIALLALSTLSLAQDSTIKAATAAAEQWLGIVDAGQYAKSWSQAAPFFQSKVSEKQWEDALNQSQKPLGKMLSRQFKSGLPTTNLPGAPAGKYCVIQFRTKFSDGGSMIETVTPMLDKDGQWKVSGYYIKPD
jgi:uncharacterized membrane protein